MVQSGTARCAFQSPYLTHRTAVRPVIIAYVDERGPFPNGGHRSSRLASVVQPDRFRTTDVRACALNAWLRRTHVEVLMGLPEQPKTEPERRSHMGKLEGKVAVITGGSSGLALASAKRFVEEGAYVFITGRRQKALDEAVKLIGRNVTGVRGDAANLDDLDRLFDTVKREKGKIDVLYASAGMGEAVPLGEITEQHFDATFGLNTRGTLFTVQKALPMFNDGGSIFMTGSVASVKGFPGWGVYSASKAALRSFARTWLNELKGRNIRVNVLSPGPIATPMQDQVLTEEAKRMFESVIPRGKMGRPEEIAAVAVFLASDDSNFVNGVELSADGGLSAI
jgi:NAD(P)-dependent dehydrogenase (short-subunit alcohol dehydrogenase family)